MIDKKRELPVNLKALCSLYIFIHLFSQLSKYKLCQSRTCHIFTPFDLRDLGGTGRRSNICLCIQFPSDPFQLGLYFLLVFIDLSFFLTSLFPRNRISFIRTDNWALTNMKRARLNKDKWKITR